MLGVNLALLTETRTTGRHPRLAAGYRVEATVAPSASQGGVALVWDEEHPAFEVEELKLQHANVLSFELQLGVGQQPVAERRVLAFE